MGSSLPLSPPSLLPNKLRYNSPFIGPWNPFTSSRITRQRNFCSLISSPERNLEASWIHSEANSHDEFRGWSVHKPELEDRCGIPKFVLAGVGTSMAILIAACTYFSFSKKGFKFRFDAPFHSFHELLMSSESTKVSVKVAESTALGANQDTKVDAMSVVESDVSKPKVNRASALGESKRILVPVAADPIQQEALCVLKKLKNPFSKSDERPLAHEDNIYMVELLISSKHGYWIDFHGTQIIENDASADELCTRREYARWFVKANSMLERNPKHRIVPMILIAGSTVTAFNDVSVNDPDFWCIQALGEAGIIFSKLATVNSSSVSDMGNSDGQGRFDFSPESFISRFDLVNWKAMLEYPFTSEMKEKMLRTKVGLLDLSASSLDASPQFLMDLMADDKSIIRRVFGNIRHLQPQNLVTKAQAAVALTSGRMAEAVRSELSRLEGEDQSRLAEMQEIRSKLIQRGEIQRIWEEKLNTEKERGFEVERDFQVALLVLEEEKVARDKRLADYMKESAALDYQQQLLLSLRKEVDGMYDRLANERAYLLAQQKSLEKLFADLRNQQDAMFEAKSVLQAEKEALRILRCWVEEEAQRIQVQSKNLQQAAQRWKWN